METSRFLQGDKGARWQEGSPTAPPGPLLPQAIRLGARTGSCWCDGAGADPVVKIGSRADTRHLPAGGLGPELQAAPNSVSAPAPEPASGGEERNRPGFPHFSPVFPVFPSRDLGAGRDTALPAVPSRRLRLPRAGAVSAAARVPRRSPGDTRHPSPARLQPVPGAAAPSSRPTARPAAPVSARAGVPRLWRWRRLARREGKASWPLLPSVTPRGCPTHPPPAPPRLSVVKTHLAVQLLPTSFQDEDHKGHCSAPIHIPSVVIYIACNHKDVVVSSSYFFCQMSKMLPDPDMLGEFLETFMAGKSGVAYGSWCESEWGWWEKKQKEQLLSLFCEDMKKMKVQMILWSQGKEVVQGMVVRILHHTSFGDPRKNPAANCETMPTALMDHSLSPFLWEGGF
uniref:Sulfotransferase n=1 Tax=Strigops habroptila TaxID=2489341 RepID=A0A672UF33_STRHB